MAPNRRPRPQFRKSRHNHLAFLYDNPKQREEPCAFDYDGERVTLLYLPSALPKSDEQAREMSAEERIATLANCITAWDVTDAQGGPYPIDAESMAEAPFDFLVALVGALHEAEAKRRQQGG